jgi:hypothetical protein
MVGDDRGDVVGVPTRRPDGQGDADGLDPVPNHHPSCVRTAVVPDNVTPHLSPQGPPSGDGGPRRTTSNWPRAVRRVVDAPDRGPVHGAALDRDRTRESHPVPARTTRRSIAWCNRHATTSTDSLP